MKTKQLTLTLLLAALATAGAAPEDRTALAVKAHAESLDGKEVSVEVTHLTPMPRAGDDKCSVVLAHTYDTGEDRPAGTILIAVPKVEYDKLVDKYGAAPETGIGRPIRNRDTRRLTGPLRLTPNKVAYINLTDGLAPDGLMGKVQAKTDEPKKPDPKNKPKGPIKPKPKPKPKKR